MIGLSTFDSEAKKYSESKGKNSQLYFPNRVSLFLIGAYAGWSIKSAIIEDN